MKRSTRREPIDWKHTVLTMLANGWQLSQIGRRIGISRSGMCDIAKGRTAEPKGSAAVLLYDARNDPPPPRQRGRPLPPAPGEPS